MPLIVETGGASSTSESYVSVTDADAYFFGRGVVAWASLTTADKEAALRRAVDYMTATYRLRWTGYRATDTQALDWPRQDVPRADGFGGFLGSFNGSGYYPSNIVPIEVQRANAELAFKAASGELLADTEQAIKSETVGPLQTVYQDNSTSTKRYSAVDRMLAPFLQSIGSVMLVRA